MRILVGHDVLVVAPSSDRSGSGAAIGKLYDTVPRTVDRIEWSDHPAIPVHSLDAPPATAVLAACLGAFGELPDLVAAGVNPGANTGHLVLHSGTVGAALTGASFGIPGIAVSIPWSDSHEYHWDTATSFAVAAVEWAAKPDDGPRVLNINVPNMALTHVRGIRDAQLAPHGEVWVASADASSGVLVLDLAGRDDAAPGTDVAALQAGCVSVTPLVGVDRAAATGAAEALEAARG
jgi:5'-nucleotidase